MIKKKNGDAGKEEKDAEEKPSPSKWK